MEGIIILAIIISGLAILGALSLRFGVDSRTSHEGWNSPQNRPL